MYDIGIQNRDIRAKLFEYILMAILACHSPINLQFLTCAKFTECACGTGSILRHLAPHRLEVCLDTLILRLTQFPHWCSGTGKEEEGRRRKEGGEKEGRRNGEGGEKEEEEGGEKEKGRRRGRKRREEGRGERGKRNRTKLELVRREE